MPRKIDAVCVSLGYSDFLANTLASNKPVFDRLVVVTSPDDRETIKVCAHHWVECLQTDVMFRNGQTFNKGAAINAGLEHIQFTDWCVHLDADVVLPPRAGEFLRNIALNDQVLYGCDRLMVRSYEEWARFVSSPSTQHYPASAWPAGFPVGYRVVWPGEGWLPIGYFQLFNRNALALRDPLYPTQFDTAADSDVQFALQWSRMNRALLPEFFVYHLESEAANPGDIGVNWRGRRTKFFGPQETP